VAERSQERDRICVARIGAAHGVRGEVKLWSFTADPAAVADYGPLETADGRTVEIEAMRPAKEFFVARLKGVADRDAAERLRNAELLVPRERLPAPAEADEFYHADLIGLAVVDTAGTALGSVVAVHNFGAGDLIEVSRPEGRDTVMLAFTQAVVPEIDLAGGRVVVAHGALESASKSGAL
jgi:16S rRNA processing protein RimM